MTATKQAIMALLASVMSAVGFAVHAEDAPPSAATASEYLRVHARQVQGDRLDALVAGRTLVLHRLSDDAAETATYRSDGVRIDSDGQQSEYEFTDGEGIMEFLPSGAQRFLVVWALDGKHYACDGEECYLVAVSARAGRTAR